MWRRWLSTAAHGATPTATATATATPTAMPMRELLAGQLHLSYRLQKQKITMASHIQRHAIPPLLAGRDALVSDVPGSGKTLAYAVPGAQRLQSSVDAVQAMVVVPTRELTVQVARVFRDVCVRGKSKSNKPPLRVSRLVGQPRDDVLGALALRTPPHVVVGTPAIMAAAFGQGGPLSVRKLRFAAFDEFDQLMHNYSVRATTSLLDRVRALPEEPVQMAWVGASLPSNVDYLAQLYLRDGFFDSRQVPRTVGVRAVRHEMLRCATGKPRLEALARWYEASKPRCSLVFVNNRRDVDPAVKFFRERGWRALPLSMDLSKTERQRAVAAAGTVGKVDFVVGTEAMARGMHFEAVTHVVNLQAPMNHVSYLHRAGRVGRLHQRHSGVGERDVVVTVVRDPGDESRLQRVRSELGVEIGEAVIGKEEAVVGKEEEEEEEESVHQ